MPRNYTRKSARAKDEAAGFAGGGTSGRGANSTRGKKKRVSASDLDTRTIVASNPFDEDHQHHQSHLHQVHHIHQPQPHLHQPHHPQHPQQHPQHHGSPAPIQAPPYNLPPHAMPMHHQHPPHQAQQYPVPQPQPHQHQHQHQHQHLHQQHQINSTLRQPGPPPPHHMLETIAHPQQVMSPTPPPPGSRPAPPQQHSMYAFQQQGYGIASPPPQAQQAPVQHQASIMHQMEAPGHASPMQQTSGPYASVTPLQASQQQPQPHQHQQQHIVLFCVECRQPIYQDEARIMCRAGCDSYYHRHCSGLTELACELLLREPAAEWACNRCICGDRRIPVVRTIHQNPSQQNDCRQPVWLQQ